MCFSLVPQFTPHALAKTFMDAGLDEILTRVDSLLFDVDKYKQRAGAEILVGILRGMLRVLRVTQFLIVSRL